MSSPGKNNTTADRSTVFDLLDTLADLASKESPKKLISGSLTTDELDNYRVKSVNDVGILFRKVVINSQIEEKGNINKSVIISTTSSNNTTTSSNGRQQRRPRAMSEPWAIDDSHAVMQLTALSNIKNNNNNEFTPVPQNSDSSGSSSEMLSQYHDIVEA